jgi:hypothetical protein
MMWRPLEVGLENYFFDAKRYCDAVRVARAAFVHAVQDVIDGDGFKTVIACPLADDDALAFKFFFDLFGCHGAILG